MLAVARCTRLDSTELLGDYAQYHKANELACLQECRASAGCYGATWDAYNMLHPSYNCWLMGEDYGAVADRSFVSYACRTPESYKVSRFMTQSE